MFKFSRLSSTVKAGLFLAATLPAPIWAATDISFIVDGSGSINSTDFSIQKNGIIAALQDPLTIPVDGSIAVSVVQFSGSARIESAYRVIQTPADVTAVVTAVTSMRQINGSTGPGLGINTASADFDTNARTAASQSFCLSTDGTTNTGPSVSSTIDAAKNSNYGLDKFSVIAIEDLPSFTASDAQQHYGPYTFGGGNVFVVQNAVEFANTIGSLCLGTPLKLVGMEVTQVVQDLENSINLIEGKKTLVRTYLEPGDSSSQVKASARLRGYRNGQELTNSPLTSVNTGAAIIAKPDALKRRNSLDDSLNFELPTSWTQAGDIDLKLEGVGSSLDCQEVADSNPNDCTASVTFEKGAKFQVKTFKVRYTDGNGTVIVPSDQDMSNLDDRLLALSPANSIDKQRGTLNMGSFSAAVNAPQASDVNISLETMRVLDGCTANCTRRYYGAVDQTGRLLYGTGATGGLANGIPGTVSSGVIRDGESYGRNRHLHEIGHSLGLHHAVQGPSNAIKNGACGARASSSAPDFPNFFTVNGVQRATLGDMSQGDNKLIYGWDSLRNTVIDPTKVFELMSYCGNQRWVSDYTYTTLLQILKSNFGAASAPVSGNATAIPKKYVIYRATLDDSDNVSNLQRVGEVMSTTPPQTPSTSDYELALTDANGSEISSSPFTPIEMDPDSIDGNAAVSGEAPSLALVVIEDDVNAAGVVIKKQGTELAKLQASANAPTIQVISPNGGESLPPGTVATFSWSALDADGDTLKYTVQFSPDNGQTWETLVTDYTDTSFDVNVDELQKTSQGLIRVQVTDGFHVAQDQSDTTFISPNSPPQCQIASPTAQQVFGSVQPITFTASTFDAEDGTVNAVQWTSDLSGNLGAGEEIVVTADKLNEGVHTITMTCQDSSGATDTADVSIEVLRVLPPPNAAPAAADDSFTTVQDKAFLTPNVLSNDTDANQDALNVSSADSASVSGGTVVDNSDGTFTYTPKTGFIGDDSFDYIVADGKGGSDTGTVQIKVLEKGDVDGSGRVNTDDVVGLIRIVYLNQPTSPAADYNGDSKTNTDDVVFLIRALYPTPTTP